MLAEDVDYVDYGIKYINLQLHEDKMGLKMTLYNNNCTNVEEYSPSFLINNLLKVTVRHEKYITGNQYTFSMFVRFSKVPSLENHITTSHMVMFTSNQLSIKNKQFCTCTDTWQLICKMNKNSLSYEFDVDMKLIRHMLNQTGIINTLEGSLELIRNSFAPLHEDEELTDFELRGEDGVIRVHRAVLATVSPVLRSMLCGTWKETTEGHVEVQGTSQSTLQHLKDYIYLNSLPETGLEQLLLLASYYMMPELEQECVNKIVSSLTADNAYNMLEFAMEKKVTRLALTIMESLQFGKVLVEDIWQRVNKIELQEK